MFIIAIPTSYVNMFFKKPQKFLTPVENKRAHTLRPLHIYL